MLASPLSAAFMGDQPMVIIPQHAMPSSAPESFYYNNAFGLGGQGMRTSFPSFGGAVTAHGSPMMTNAGGVSPVAPNAFSSNGASFGSPGVLQSPLSAHAFHPSAFPLASNDMAVDDHTPTSPSSSNSNDLDDEESAAAILHAMESGSLSPRSSPLTQAGTPRSLKHRRSAVSPLGRRKRVSSLSEASPLSQGKEGAEDYFDYEANEFGVADAPFGARGPTSQSTARWPASSTESAFGTGAQGFGNGFGNRGASHSLPSASALSFSPSSSRGPSSAFSSVANGAPAQFNGAGSMGRGMNGGIGASNSNPIPIPNRHHEGFTSNSFAPSNANVAAQAMMPGQYGFGSPIKPHAQKYATFSAPPLVPSHSHPHLQMHHHHQSMNGMSGMGPAPPMGMAHHHHSTGALPLHMHGSASLMNSHGSLAGSNASVSSSASNAGMFGSHGSSSSSSSSVSHSSHKKKSRNARSRLDNHQCPNCHTSDSPLWRNCQIKGKILHLCNSCGLRYKKHKYCPHCYKVYYDAETNSHEWTQCAQCHNWTHKSCLSAAGIDSGAPGTYKCVRCLGQSPDSA